MANTITKGGVPNSTINDFTNNTGGALGPGGRVGQGPITNGRGPISGPTSPDLLSTLTGSQRDAYEALNSVFSSYGLGTLAGKIFDYVKQGFGADTISILLQQTDEYKQRFAGNELRKAKGLPVLSPAEYLSTESSYRQLMRQAGLPDGFYDQPSDFNDFIGKDVSPTELKSRVDLASQASVLASPELKNALLSMYGIDDSHITAYFLDPERALPTIQKQAAAAQIGAEALKRGLNISTHAEDYAMAGISSQQAAQAYGQIAQQLPGYATIAGQYGMNVGQADLEASLFGATNAEDQQRANNVTRLASWNRARSQGAAGGARYGGLAQRTAGQV